GPCPAHAADRSERAAVVCGSLARPAHPRGAPRAAPGRVDPHRVLAARAVLAEPTPGTDARADHGAGLVLRLRPDLEPARGLHQLPTPEDRSRRRAPPAPDR